MKNLGFKFCPVCKETKDVAEFNKNSHNSGGLHSECRACSSIRKKREWKENPDAHRATNRKSLYGLSDEKFQDLLKEQNGCCAVCGDVFIKTPHVDHAHSTGGIRGLLCSRCNSGLGQFKDSTERLLKAVAYLNRTS